MTEKNKYTRENIRANCLRRVVILIDHERISNIERWIDTLKEKFCAGVFNRYIPIIPDTDSFNKRGPRKIASRLNIPVSELMRDPIHFFTNSNQTDYFPESFSLEVSRYTLGITIDIDKYYQGIDHYFVYISTIIQELFNIDSFITIKRIAVRKYDVFGFKNQADLRTSLEESTVFSNKIEDTLINLDRNYLDEYISEPYLNVAYRRMLRCIEKENDDWIFRVIIDTDVSVDQELIEAKKLVFPGDVHPVLMEINYKLFEIFRNSVTSDYLGRSIING